MTVVEYTEQGQFAPKKIARILRTTIDELALTLGFEKGDLQRKDRITSDITQGRLCQFIGVLNKVEPRFGSKLMAYAWYRSEPLAGFGGRTAMQLVCEDRSDDVLNYIDAEREMRVVSSRYVRSAIIKLCVKLAGESWLPTYLSVLGRRIKDRKD